MLPIYMPPYDHLGWVSATIDGKYAVEAVTGEDGFGVVYRGTLLALRAPIAIKCLKLPNRLVVDSETTTEPNCGLRNHKF